MTSSLTLKAGAAQKKGEGEGAALFRGVYPGNFRGNGGSDLWGELPVKHDFLRTLTDICRGLEGQSAI